MTVAAGGSSSITADLISKQRNERGIHIWEWEEDNQVGKTRLSKIAGLSALCCFTHVEAGSPD